jgi:hypothetical protein
MFEAVISGLNDILHKHRWVEELAAILPLSALIDFIDVPKKLHIFELAGAVPLWSWPVTPAGSRLLLSDKHTQRTCCLDRYGSSVALIALDGYYGDQYTASNPETIRLCLSSQRPRTIKNGHENMSGEDLRIQNLELVHVSRLQHKNQLQPAQSWLRRVFLDPWWMYSCEYLMVSAIGWIMLLGTIVMSGILQCYLSLAFLVAVPVTGSVVFSLYGSTPRRLLVEKVSAYNRLIVVAEHMNTVDWIVFYGESTVVNSLLNRPLEPTGPQMSRAASVPLRMVLRILILGQWGLVLGAAALKDWNAYFITLWIAFCIFSHAYLIPPRMEANDWMESCAHIRLERYQTQLSSRRALLNTIMALNPDTFSWSKPKQQEDRTKLCEGAMRWVNPVLAPGYSRTKWEEATRAAMDEAAERYSAETLASSMWQSKKGHVLSSKWNDAYPTGEENYWKPFILEGIHMAAKIKRQAKLPGRGVIAETM